MCGVVCFVVTDPSDDTAVLERLIDYWTPLAVRALAEAGVFAAFGTEPHRVDEIADAVGVDAATLGRFLRTVGTAGVVEDAGDGRLRLTALGLRLVPGTTRSLSGLANLKPFELHAWAEAAHSLRTGDPAFPVHHGTTLFEWLAVHPRQAAHFDAGMRARTGTLLDIGLPAITWPLEGTIVDIGGGSGHLLQRVLADRPGLRGVVFDLPHVIDGAREQLPSELDGRVEFVAGSFFDGVPGGAEMYVMSNILHDWPDHDALRILHRIRAAIPPTGTLRLFESVLDDASLTGLGVQLDLHMLVVLGAKERTAQEWRTLLQDGGFHLDNIQLTPGLSWLDAATT